MFVMKKKILFIGDLGGGGKERRMSELIRYLSETGRYEIFLMLNKDARKDYPQTLTYVDGYKEVDFRCSIIGRMKQVRLYLKQIKPDIVHSWHEYLSLYIDLQKWQLPKFYYIAGFVADANSDGFLRELANQLTYRLSNKVISNSRAGLLSHHAPLKKSVVIYNGFNKDRLPQGDYTYETRNSLSLGVEQIVIMAGRMQNGKDYDTLIDAIKCLNQKKTAVKYLFVGKGENEERYKTRVRDEHIDNIIFTGFRSDIERLYQIATISVLCTDENHKEGVSNVIMESMAMGLPVIATRAGGTPEIVKDGVNGYLIDIGDSKLLAHRIDEILNNKILQKNLSDNAKSTIEEKFTIKKMVDEYVNIYNSAARK